MTITLPVTSRDEKTTTSQLRAGGNVPAVVYGPKQEPINISIEAKVFDKIRKEAGESTIVELTGLAKPIEVLVKGVDFNPIKQQVTHVDFYAIERGKEMTAHVVLHFIGEAPVEDSKAGSVTKVLHEVEVTCMPKDLPSHIDVDLSMLVSVEDKIHIKDLKVKKGVTIHADAEDSVAVISPTRLHTEEETVAEVEQKGKEVSGEEKSE